MRRYGAGSRVGRHDRGTAGCNTDTLILSHERRERQRQEPDELRGLTLPTSGSIHP
jgi:hypothetical protein